MNDGSGEVPEHEHHQADIDKEPDPPHSHGACEGEVDPLSGREFGGGRQEHARPPDEEHRTTRNLAPHVGPRDATRGALGPREGRSDAEKSDDDRGEDDQ